MHVARIIPVVAHNSGVECATIARAIARAIAEAQAERGAMASKPRLAYTVVHSSGTYGAATPYAVVSTASGMPHMPAYRSEEEAQQVADRLNTEETQRTTKQLASATEQRKVDRLQAKASAHDEGDAIASRE